MGKQFVSKSLTTYVQTKCTVGGYLPTLVIECQQCEFRVFPDDKGKCPVCGVRLKLVEQLG